MKIVSWGRRLWQRNGKVMIYPMVLAQVVGLMKLEAALQLADVIQVPSLLRLSAFSMGGLLSLVVAYLNVRIVRRYSS